MTLLKPNITVLCKTRCPYE